MTRAVTPCRVADCGERGNRVGLCHAHAEWKRRHGGVEPTHLITQQGRTVVARVMTKVVVDGNGCWIWQGARGGNGRRYGLVRVERRTRPVHRVTYEALVGAIPDGLELDHLCRVTLCCNPEHLEPVTHLENVLRSGSPPAINARKTHCKRGHELEGDNVYVRPGGGRACRLCRVEQAA